MLVPDQRVPPVEDWTGWIPRERAVLCFIVTGGRVLLMLDETIITETPPLYARYGKVGQQAELPITGNRAKRILHGVLVS